MWISRGVQLGLEPPAGTRPSVQMNLLTAAAAAACRISADAIAFVHGQGLAGHAAALSSGNVRGTPVPAQYRANGPTDALLWAPQVDGLILAFKLLRFIAEECSRKQAGEAAVQAVKTLAPQTFGGATAPLTVLWPQHRLTKLLTASHRLRPTKTKAARLHSCGRRVRRGHSLQGDRRRPPVHSAVDSRCRHQARRSRLRPGAAESARSHSLCLRL